MRRRSTIGWGLAFLIGGGLFVQGVRILQHAPRTDASIEMEVALPLFVQVAMAGGDRHLAANMDVFRALVVTTARMNGGEYRVLAKVQRDASWLNPAHEDNYYIAAAILPWNGQIDAAQTILLRAARVRPYDYQPAFYWAFDRLHFQGDAEGASAYLREAAEHLTDPDERLAMQNFAARWLDKSRDLELAIRVVEAMAKQARRKDFRNYLLMRAGRLKSLVELRRAAENFRQTHGVPPKRLDDLVADGQIRALPNDPFGFGFDLDPSGQPILLNAPKGQ